MDRPLSLRYSGSAMASLESRETSRGAHGAGFVSIVSALLVPS